MARGPVLAAGGIVLRHEQPPLIAVVRLRKRDEWVLPKGKLDRGETAIAAAAREVLEETGHDVTVHEFLGTLVYETNGRSKVVHYWRMEACSRQAYELMHDIRAVDWLPLDAALERLSRTSERAFLANVGPLALLSLSRETKAMAQASRKPRDRDVAMPEPRTPLPPESLPAPMPVVQAEIVRQADAVEAMTDAATPASVIDTQPAPAPAAGAAEDRADGGADKRRWSLARKVRDWLPPPPPLPRRPPRAQPRIAPMAAPISGAGVWRGRCATGSASPPDRGSASVQTHRVDIGSRRESALGEEKGPAISSRGLP